MSTLAVIYEGVDSLESQDILLPVSYFGGT